MLAVDELIAECQELFIRIQSIFDKSTRLNSSNAEEFQTSIERLSELKTQFNEVQRGIRSFNCRSSDPKEKIEVVKITLAFTDIIDSIINKYKPFRPSAPVERKERTQEVVNNLPRLELPKFSGNLEDWHEFIALFDSLVHNVPSLPEINKFHYLRSSLHDDALAVISGYTLEERNYRSAYDALKDRYQNRRRLAQMYFRKVFDYSSSH